MKQRAFLPALLTLLGLFAAQSTPASAEAVPALPDLPPPAADAAGKPGDPSVDALADRMQAFYDKTQTFQADFTRVPQ